MENDERRKHKRYALHDEAYVFGEERVGRVVDISIGGMTVYIFQDSGASCDGWECLLKCKKIECKVTGLKLKQVWQDTPTSSLFGNPSRMIGVKFDNLTKTQLEQIIRHISVIKKMKKDTMDDY